MPALVPKTLDKPVSNNLSATLLGAGQLWAGTRAVPTVGYRYGILQGLGCRHPRVVAFKPRRISSPFVVALTCVNFIRNHWIARFECHHGEPPSLSWLSWCHSGSCWAGYCRSPAGAYGAFQCTQPVVSLAERTQVLALGRILSQPDPPFLTIALSSDCRQTQSVAGETDFWQIQVLAIGLVLARSHLLLSLLTAMAEDRGFGWIDICQVEQTLRTGCRSPCSPHSEGDTCCEGGLGKEGGRERDRDRDSWTVTDTDRHRDKGPDRDTNRVKRERERESKFNKGKQTFSKDVYTVNKKDGYKIFHTGCAKQLEM